ncbi:uncharacterized protein LOC129579469 [Sitodiplosis mosellana]|uniref:uncharacterized protein LOC129579469 n=1 Tax=Sitodiplosis mosellana TaxID=263140 RepID=UPI002443A01E|nr:uncharacterized protein LOC129579469 [Sitodiplosis mosellana]
MGKEILKIVIAAFISSSIIVGAHVFKDYKNKELVLTSVYDAMKNNVQQDMQNKLNQDEVLSDSRNKRNTNTNEKLEYYDQIPSESQNEWSIVNAPLTSDLVCTRRGDHSQTKITVSDHNTGLTVALLIKYGFVLLAALALPVILFKVFVLPFKILLGLKAISLLNSLLLGSLLLKYKFSKPYGGHGGYIPGTIPGSTTAASSSSSSSSSAVSAAGNSLELRYHDL